MTKTTVASCPEDDDRFEPLTLRELSDILGTTIKRDDANKQVALLCFLSAYTENNQQNVCFIAPSSTGKSHIPTEIALFFPHEDVLKLGSASPTAFFHEVGEFDKKNNRYIVNLERKIVIFLDQPHHHLLERLRSLLSHDAKEIVYKITDKTSKHGTRTKTIVIRGFPAVAFCSARLRLDEQEITRFILLSPEMSQEKLREGVLATIRREADPEQHRDWLDEHPGRRLLKDRIQAIRDARIAQINLPDEDMIESRFFSDKEFLRPRDQRDIGRFIGLAKAHALLNWRWRKQKGSTLVAAKEDIEAAAGVWTKLAVPQNLNLPPYLYELYRDVIVPAQLQGNPMAGLTRNDLLRKHYSVYGRPLDPIKLRQEILPMLEQAGMIREDPDPDDRRKKLIFTVHPLSVGENSE